MRDQAGPLGAVSRGMLYLRAMPLDGALAVKAKSSLAGASYDEAHLLLTRLAKDRVPAKP
jgi:hypothetical protein